MKFSETLIPVKFCQDSKSLGFNFLEEHVDKIVKILFTTVSEFLKTKKNKDKPVAVAIYDRKGNFVAAGKVQYHSNENEEMPGNWSYEWPVDISDLADADVISLSHNDVLREASSVAQNLCGFKFNSPTYTIDLLTEAVVSILDWLDENAKESEVVSVELIGFFEASVVVENGVKIKSITPDGAMKRIIKDDAALEM